MQEFGKDRNIADRGRWYRIRDLALGLEKKYQLSNRLGLVYQQSELFDLYLMGYLSQKSDTEAQYFLQSPGAPVLANVPIFHHVYAFMENREKSRVEMSQEIFNRASSLASEIRNVAKNEALVYAAQLGGLDLEELQNEIGTDSPELNSMTDLLLKRIGSPAAIRNAANLISSAYLGVRTKSKEDQSRRMEATIKSITIKTGPKETGSS